MESQDLSGVIRVLSLILAMLKQVTDVISLTLLCITARACPVLISLPLLVGLSVLSDSY